MNPFINKLREFGLSLYSSSDSEIELSNTPVPDSTMSVRVNLFHFSDNDYAIRISDLNLFKNKFVLPEEYSKLPICFFDLIRIDFEVNRLSIYFLIDDVDEYGVQVIEDHIRKYPHQYESLLTKERLVCMFSGKKPERLLAESLSSLVLSSFWSPVTMPTFKLLYKELFDAYALEFPALTK